MGKKIGSSDPGLVTMLKCLNKFRKRDPEGEEEKEFVENLFNAVCVSLTDCHANKVFHLFAFYSIIWFDADDMFCVAFRLYLQK